MNACADVGENSTNVKRGDGKVEQDSKTSVESIMYVWNPKES